MTQNPDKRIEIYEAIKEIKKIGLSFDIMDKCIKQYGINYTFSTIKFVKENNGDWKRYYKLFEKEIKNLSEDTSFKTKAVLIYRKIRLNFVFLKKYF